MKIRLTIICPKIAAQVGAEVDELRHAVDVGDMDAVDSATAHLLELTVDCRSIDLSEEDWRTFMTDIGSRNPGFTYRYLLPSELFISLLPTATTSDQVLELPIDSDPQEDETHV
jgi:hypothetical protein